MYSTNILKSGHTQTVSLPESFQFNTEKVIVRRFANGVLLLPADAPWEIMKEALDEFEPGFILERNQPDIQAREDMDK